MLEALSLAFFSISSPLNLAYLLGGVCLGLVVGILPGFGGTVGLSLLLPFIYGMDPVTGIALLVGVLAVVCTSDTFPAVLMGIPGSVSSQATVVDGFPLAKKGEAARALSAAFTASMIGGVFGAIVLTGVILIARPLVLAFGAGEMLMLSVIGITMVGLLTGRSMLKGLIAACLGLLIGAIGVAPATSEYRMDFEILYLSNGLPLLVVAIAIFSVPEIIDLLRRDSAITERILIGQGTLRGIKDAIHHRWLVLRCSAIGALIGILPGLGGAVVDWIAYAHAKHTEREAPTFGEGDIRGVLAPESANNAKEGGALVPTLIFGIPGSAGTAVFIGGLILLGVEPGLTMATRQLDLVYAIVWSLALANVVGTLLCLTLARPLALLTRINFNWIAPFLISLIFFAGFQASRSWGDLIAILAIGSLAVFMRRFGYPRPALMIGFVLSHGLEVSFHHTISFYGWSVFTRPLFLMLAVIAALLAWVGWRLIQQQDRCQERYRLTTGQWVFLALVAATASAAILLSLDLRFLGQVFPITLGSILLLLAAALARQMAIGGETNSAICDEEWPVGGETGYHSGLIPNLGWLLLLVMLSLAAGFYLALGMFVFLALIKRARASLPAAAAGAVVSWVFAASFAGLMHLRFPQGLLQTIATLPWPAN